MRVCYVYKSVDFYSRIEESYVFDFEISVS